MARRLAACALLLWVAMGLATAQTELPEGDILVRLGRTGGGRGHVEIVQPSGLTRALHQSAAQHAKQPTLRGYRVRVFRDVGKAARDASERIQQELLTAMPGLPVYRTYDSPNYKVAVGDFRTRFEALYFRKRLLTRYPQAFVVAETINFPNTRPNDSVPPALGTESQAIKH